MYRLGTVLCVFFVLFGDLAVPQLEGGLFGIFSSDGVQVSVPEIFGISYNNYNKEAEIITITTPPPAEPTRVTPKFFKPSTEQPTCNHTPTMVNGKRSCQGKIIFQENFRKLADKKWTIENRFGGEPDYEFVLYQPNTENVYTHRNTLYIKPSLLEEKYSAKYASESEGINLGDSCTGAPTTPECIQKPRAWQILPPVISSQITTRGHFSFSYGIVEIKAKLPKGDWIYPELSLRPKSSFYGPGYDSGAIKIAFLPGNPGLSKDLFGGVVLSQSDSARSYGIKMIHSDTNWNDDYHLFMVEWKTDRITISVDHQEYANIIPPQGGFASEEEQLEIEPETATSWRKGTKLAPFDKEMYLSLGVGVGGQSFTDKDFPNKPWKNDDPKAQLNFYRNRETWSKTWDYDSELLVDYVKVYAL